MKKLLLCTCAVLSITDFVRSQNAVLDSLKNLLKSAKDDTNEVILLNNISKELTNTGDYDRAGNYAEQAKLISDRLNYKTGQADYYSAVGVIAYYKGNYAEALSDHFNALKIREEIKDKKGIAGSYNNISIIYTYQKNYKEALHYLLPALQAKIELGERKGLVSTYNNIGLAYDGLGQPDEAVKNYRMSLAISYETKNNKGIGNALNNIGAVFYTKHMFDSAEYYFQNALAIRTSTNYKQGMMSSLNMLGEVSFDLKKNKDAFNYFSQALIIAKEIGEMEGMRSAYLGLSTYYEGTGNFKEALANFKLYRVMEDSIYSAANRDNALKTELNYKFEKQQAEEKAAQDIKDAEQKRKEEGLEADAQRRQIFLYFISGILVLVVIFAFFMVRSVIQKRKDNRELDLRNRKIENAYSIIEKKNKEITDSIRYAKRIQDSLLPPERYLDRVLGRKKDDV